MKESKELKTLTVALRSNYLAIQQVANKQDELKATFTTVSLVSWSHVPSNQTNMHRLPAANHKRDFRMALGLPREYITASGNCEGEQPKSRRP